MPSGLIALLDDVAMIAKLASASLDDVVGATAKAGAKAAGVVIDDTAVTPRYVQGLSPERELPIIAKIALGSLKNKLLFLLPGALLLSAFAPFLITPMLMIGGSYLAFEAMEKIVEVVTGEHHDEAELAAAETPAELEARQVKGAIRTDLILSGEIMAIALAELDGLGIAEQGAALALVAIAVTLGVYGVVAIIVKLDDVGLHLAKRANNLAKRVGAFLVRMVPGLLRSLSSIGTAAMLWVGGGILLHGVEDMKIHHFPETVHEAANELAAQFGPGEGIVAWLANAFAAAIMGAIVGLAIVLVVRQFTRRPDRLVVDG
jgi:uncharacterized protein